ncbi:MAG: ribonuclease P protein subunit [Nitrososphaerota archaeon]|nr:ribonuclease P protein subunit [Nitrososphaerota archaeon]
MNVIGERVKILSAKDPTLTGKTGIVVLESANTLVLQSLGRNVRVAKSGAAFMLVGSGKIVTGLDIMGRLQDRLGRKSA